MENRKNKSKQLNGYTLVEVIIALMLISVMAVGIIPPILNTMLHVGQNRGLTAVSFESQAEIEKTIHELQEELRTTTNVNQLASTRGDQIETMSFRTADANMYKSQIQFPKTPDKTAFVFLSQQLARAENQQRLVAGNVKLEIKGKPTDTVARLANSPELLGRYDDLAGDPTFQTNIFRWYYSRAGIADPAWPTDYDMVDFTIIPKTSDTVVDLKPYANRFMMFSVTPVDKQGVRGLEVISSNRIYVLGPEWRANSFAYADINNNIEFGTGDVKIPNLVLQKSFDSSQKFPDPANPSVESNPANSDIFIPGKIGASGTNTGTIKFTGSDVFNWLLDKNLHVASNLVVENSGNVQIISRTGSINFYQFLRTNNFSQAVLDGLGVPVNTNDGSKIITAGDISLSTQNTGDINMQAFTVLSGKNIVLEPTGRMNLIGGLIQSSGNIVINSGKNLHIPGNRDIVLRGMTIAPSKIGKLELTPTVDSGRKILIQSSGGIVLDNMDVIGNSIQPSFMEIRATDPVVLRNNILQSISLIVGSNAIMDGGSFQNGMVIVEDGKQLQIDSANSVVQNNGIIFLNTTGRLTFTNGNSIDLEKELSLELAGTGPVYNLLMTNYNRTVKAPATGNLTLNDFNFRPLGASDSNIMYTAIVTGGGPGNLALNYTLSADNSIQFTSTGSGTGNAVIEVTFRDRYAPDLISNTVKIVVPLTNP